MKTITLQTRNVAVQTKNRAEKRAVNMGFNSLQDVVRLFVKDFADEKATVSMDWGVNKHGIPYVSPSEQKELEKELDQIDLSSKNFVSYKDIGV